MEIEVGSARVEEEGAGRVEDCKNLGQLRFSAINSAESGLRVRVELDD